MMYSIALEIELERRAYSWLVVNNDGRLGPIGQVLAPLCVAGMDDDGVIREPRSIGEWSMRQYLPLEAQNPEALRFPGATWYWLYSSREEWET
jgi:hypothetical protein